MKLTLLAAIFVPLGFVIWNLSDSAGMPDEETDAPMLARVSNPGAPPERGLTSTGTTAQTNPQGSEEGAAVTELAPNTAIESGTSPGTSGKALAFATPQVDLGPDADRPLMRLDVVGPAAFRAAFGQTNIGGLFASEEGERVWRPMLKPAEEIWQQWDGRGDEFEAARQRVLDYTGRIRVLWFAQPGEGSERDHVFGVFALERDASTSLTALAGDLSRAMQSFMPDEPTTQSVGERELQLLDGPGGGFVTIPVVIDGNLVAFFGEATSLESTVPLSLRALAMDVEQPSAPVSLDIDLTQLKELGEMRREPPLVKAFGLESLRQLNAVLRPNGAHAELEVEVLFGDGYRGAVDAFLPAVSTLPGLLTRVPVEATPWLTVPFSPGVLFRIGMEAEAAYNELGSQDARANLRQALYDELGVYLDTELLDHLSGEVMVLGDLWQSDDPDVFQAGDDPPLGMCIAFSLTDAVAFGMGFDKLLDRLKGLVNRHETREVDGVKITRLGSMFLTGMHMAVGQDLFAMAFGEEGVAQLEALVAGGRGALSQPLPASVQRVQHLAPAGLNGLGVIDVTALFSGQITLALEALNDSLPREMRFGFSVVEMQQWLDKLLPLVSEHDLENLVTMTGQDDRRWRLRLVW